MNINKSLVSVPSEILEKINKILSLIADRNVSKVPSKSWLHRRPKNTVSAQRTLFLVELYGSWGLFTHSEPSKSSGLAESGWSPKETTYLSAKSITRCSTCGPIGFWSRADRSRAMGDQAIRKVSASYYLTPCTARYICTLRKWGHRTKFLYSLSVQLSENIQKEIVNTNAWLITPNAEIPVGLSCYWTHTNKQNLQSKQRMNIYDILISEYENEW